MKSTNGSEGTYKRLRPRGPLISSEGSTRSNVKAPLEYFGLPGCFERWVERPVKARSKKDILLSAEDRFLNFSTATGLVQTTCEKRDSLHAPSSRPAAIELEPALTIVITKQIHERPGRALLTSQIFKGDRGSRRRRSGASITTSCYTTLDTVSRSLCRSFAAPHRYPCDKSQTLDDKYEHIIAVVILNRPFGMNGITR